MDVRNWRVYLQDWVIDYTSDENGEAGVSETRDVFSRTREGRLQPCDWFIFVKGPSDRVLLYIRTWQLQAENRERQVARVLASGLEKMQRVYDLPVPGHVLPGTPVVVEAGSAEEQELLNYGKRKLPDER